MLIGYEPVSTDDQNLALQHDALQTAGCLHSHKKPGQATNEKALSALSLWQRSKSAVTGDRYILSCR